MLFPANATLRSCAKFLTCMDSAVVRKLIHNESKEPGSLGKLSGEDLLILQQLTKLPHHDLSKAIESCIYILEHVRELKTTEQELRKFLTSSGGCDLKEDHANLFIHVWQLGLAKEETNSFSTNSKPFCEELLRVDHDISIQISSKASRDRAETISTLHFTLKEANENASIQKFSVSFDRERLRDFFFQLEDLQQQLDSKF